MRFAIVIHHENGSSYGVSVPDLPGCFSGGQTPEEAFVGAREAILLHLEGMVSDGEPLPEPQPLEEHLGNEHYRDGIWGLVDVDVADLPDKAVRVNITVPARVLATIDQWAKRESETRSGFLTLAALERIRAKSSH